MIYSYNQFSRNFMNTKITILMIVSLIFACSATTAVYLGNVVVMIQNQQSVAMTYKIAVTPQTESCNFKKCFIGWVLFYAVNQTINMGYYNSQLEVQPVFKWQGNNQNDYSLTFPQGLDQAWKQIIQLWSQKFNPFASSGQIVNQIPLQDTQMTLSKHQKNSEHDSDGELQHSEETYSFALSNKQQGQESGSAKDILFVVQNNVHKSQTVQGGSSTTRAQKILRQETQTIHINQIRQDRSSSDKEASVDIEPDIDLNLVNDAQGTDTGVDPQKYFQDPYSYPGLNKDSQNLRSDPPRVLNSEDQVNVVTINESFVVLNQSKNLHSATVFGKKLASQVNAFCQLNIVPSYTLDCYSIFTFNFLGKNKTLLIANFSRSITQNYIASSFFHNGAFVFTTKIPLPYPLDYINFKVHVNISYNFYYYAYAGVYSYSYPYRYYFYSYYYPYGNIQAEGQITVGILQAGAKINGKLINAYTYQYSRFSFYWITGQIQVYLNFYAYLYYFQYSWGYYWRYYLLFQGWGPYYTLSWTQGNTNTKYISLVYRTWTFSIYN